MKNRFGNIVYDSTLTLGLYPVQIVEDTLSIGHGLSFTLVEGIQVDEFFENLLPSIQAISMPIVANYEEYELAAETFSNLLPSLRSFSVVFSANYLFPSIDGPETFSQSLPAVQDISLEIVVVIQNVYDIDTISVSHNSLEFNLI